MKKIRFKTRAAGPLWNYGKGDIDNLDDETADALIDGNFAELVDVVKEAPTVEAKTDTDIADEDPKEKPATKRRGRGRRQ